jgi:hypothetical protein
VVLVLVPYPDAQPAEAENEIARKVEEALSRLQSVDFIASTSMCGVNITQIIFLDGVDPDNAKREVKDLVDRIRNEDRHYVTDIHTTILKQLGLNPKRLEVPGQKRNEIDFGKPIDEILA